MSTEPKTLTEAIKHFADPGVTLATMVELRWSNGVCCPTCGRDDVRFIATRRIWECKAIHAKRQFSAKVGTIFEDSALGLDKWFAAIWLIANCKNGVSSYEIHRAIGVTQKSAWFMLHRIRLAMETGSFIKGPGDSEADETFIGGLARNMHKARRARTIKGTGGAGKEVVMGVLRRGKGVEPSKVKAKHVRDTTHETLHVEIRAAVEPGSRLFTDAHRGYLGLGSDYLHETVDHAVEYVRGAVHTNGMENFWALFKRAIKGTYVSIEPCHLNSYVVEETFRFNERDDNDGGRFRKVLGSIGDKRITYRELTGHGPITTQT
jgi:transposase-like protein